MKTLLSLLDNNGNPCEVVLPLHGGIANTPARSLSLEITGELKTARS